MVCCCFVSAGADNFKSSPFSFSLHFSLILKLKAVLLGYSEKKTMCVSLSWHNVALSCNDDVHPAAEVIPRRMQSLCPTLPCSSAMAGG